MDSESAGDLLPEFNFDQDHWCFMEPPIGNELQNWMTGGNQKPDGIESDQGQIDCNKSHHLNWCQDKIYKTDGKLKSGVAQPFISICMKYRDMMEWNQWKRCKSAWLPLTHRFLEELTHHNKHKV